MKKTLPLIIIALLLSPLALKALQTPTATVTGHVYIYDGSPFPWSLIELRDQFGNRIAQQQLDDNAAFRFTVETGRHYQIVGIQPDYGYAPQALQVDVNSDVQGLKLFTGPSSWFPPRCVYSFGPPVAADNSIACYVDVTATAFDGYGNSGTSAVSRIYFYQDPSPSPTPTPTATPTPTPTPSPSPSPSPTATPTPKPSPTPVCVKRNPNGKCLKWN